MLSSVKEWHESLNSIHRETEWKIILPVLCYDLPYVNQAKVEAILIKETDIHHAFKVIAEDLESYQYGKVSGRLFTWWIYRNTPPTLTNYYDQIERVNAIRPFFDKSYIDYGRRFNKFLQGLLDKTAYLEYLIVDYFSVATLWSKYSLRIDLETQIERASYLCLRVAIQVWRDSGSDAHKNIANHYTILMKKRFLHASPTMFNSCLIADKYRNLSSCFGINVKDDINHINSVMQAILRISVSTGGLGVRISELREIGSSIAFRGVARGIIPLSVYINAGIRYAHQGGFRNGVLNLQLDVFHPELKDFLLLRDDSTPPEARALNLDNTILFTWPFLHYYRKYKMEGDMTKKMFPLFSPVNTPLLYQLRGVELFKEFERCVANTTIPRNSIDIDELMDEINRLNRVTGHPYLVNIDAASFKSNHQEVNPKTGKMNYILGTNLCLEIYQYNSDKEIFSCNLAQISVPVHVKDRASSSKTGISLYDFDQLASDIHALIPAMTQVILNNGAPLENMHYRREPKVKGDKEYVGRSTTFLDIRRNNLKRNPLGCGWSGFADACYKMGFSPVGSNATSFGQYLAACYLFNALSASVNEAIIRGKYKTFDRSPLAKGLFQFDLWAMETKVMIDLGLLSEADIEKYRKPKWDEPIDPKNWGQKPFTLVDGTIIKPSWKSLRKVIMEKGVHHSLILALMPSSTTSQYLCNNMASEVPISNYLNRLTDYGSFSKMSPYLEEDLRSLGLWNKLMIDLILANQGSMDVIPKLVADVKKSEDDRFPDFDMKNMTELKRVALRYRTATEFSPEDKMLFETAIGRYLCQGSSFNWYLKNPDNATLEKLFYDGMMYGIKTVKYYLRLNEVIIPGKNAVLNVECLKLLSKYKGEEYHKLIMDAVAKKEKEAAEKKEEKIDVMGISGLPEISTGTVCSMVEGCLQCT